IYGVVGNYKVKDVFINIDNIDIKKIENIRATHILQFFWTSTNGKVSFPLIYIPTNKTESAKWYYSKIMYLKNEIQKINYNIKLQWTSSDGFEVVLTYSKLIKEENIYHIGDWLHLLKKLRNMLERPLQNNTCKDSFGFRTLIHFYEISKKNNNPNLYVNNVS